MSMTPDERKAWAYERLDAWLLVNRWADLEDFIAQVTEVLEVEGAYRAEHGDLTRAERLFTLAGDLDTAADLTFQRQAS